MITQSQSILIIFLILSLSNQIHFSGAIQAVHQVQQQVARQSQSYGKGSQQLAAQQQLNNQMIGGKGNPSPQQMNRLPHPSMQNQQPPPQQQQWNYQAQPPRFANRPMGKDFQMQQQQQQQDNKPTMMMNSQPQMPIRQQMQGQQQQILVTGGPQQMGAQMQQGPKAGNQIPPQSVC